MKDYTDPTVWREFLIEQQLESNAPPPPRILLQVSPENLIPSLRNWARGMDPKRRAEFARYHALQVLKADEE